MSCKIFYISDFFHEKVSGGAEIFDKILISELKKAAKVARFRSEEVTVRHIDLYSEMGYNFIISNFVGLSEIVKKRLNIENYVIIEHDHKYLSNRDPSIFRDYKAPVGFVINKSFYSSAKKVFAQSTFHGEVLKNNLNLDNIESFSSSLWSDEQLDFFEKACENKKEKMAYVMDLQNPIKGTEQSVEYCKKNNIKYRKHSQICFEDYVTNLSKSEHFVFMPQTLETFSRVVAEARMLGCKIKTNKNASCILEDYFKKNSGKRLISVFRQKKSQIIEKVLNSLKTENQKEEDITVILNCYRRPYNLKMQIHALRSQTVKPKEIWLWVNDHPENRGFDFDSLKVDRIFKNNHNWKFYGRFAAALLVNTEFVAIYDDDTVPGKKWHENCLQTIKTHNGILGSAGIKLKSKIYTDHDRVGWPSKNRKTEEVDLVGHAWFFRREWLSHLWAEKPPTWDNGEDIHFSSMAKIKAGIKTFCPPHPPEDLSYHGSTMGNELGIDDKATSNNNEVGHHTFFSQRDKCIEYSLKNGWKTVAEVSL